MDEVLKGLSEHVKSGEYFTEARKWYNEKYVKPLSYRSMALCAAILFVTLASIMAMNINSLFPLVTTLQYSISVSDKKSDQTAVITKADQINNRPLLSIIQIMLKDYVQRRESYDYDKIDEQMAFVKNTSTRVVLKQFYTYLSVDNPDSPVLRYQKDARRRITIKNVRFIDDSSAEVTFTSEARDGTGQLFENMIWLAKIHFYADPIKLHVPNQTPYSFVVMDYKLKLIEDKNANS